MAVLESLAIMFGVFVVPLVLGGLLVFGAHRGLAKLIRKAHPPPAEKNPTSTEPH